MKNLTTKISSLTALIITLLIISSASTYAQGKNTGIVLTKNAIGNLKSGITSDNLGLRRSAIYYAGEYKITQVMNELNSQLKKETDNNTKILLALVIYKIGDADGINIVKKLALKDSNPEVRRMCASIYNAYVNNTSEDLVLLSK